jgi:hypothetical protein
LKVWLCPRLKLEKLINMHSDSNLKSSENEVRASPLYHSDSWFINMYIHNHNYIKWVYLYDTLLQRHVMTGSLHSKETNSPDLQQPVITFLFLTLCDNLKLVQWLHFLNLCDYL